MLRLLGADARVLFVTSASRIGRELDAAGVPHSELGFGRGRAVLTHPRKLAGLAQELGPDGALLVSPGYLAAALRIGGYRGRIVSVLHDVPQPNVTSRRRSLVKRLDFASGAWATDVEVAVSDFVLAAHGRRARRARVIHNGVDLERYAPVPTGDSTTPVVGWAGRIVEGKGLATLVAAVGRVQVRLAIAGDGPQRSAVEARAREANVEELVSFEGWVDDMPAFWNRCALAAVPTDGLVESFGMTAVEAMACGLPVVASRAGALPELVDDGVTGRLVAPGDEASLAGALAELLEDPARLQAAGQASRRRCESHFDLRATAARYLELFAGR